MSKINPSDSLNASIAALEQQKQDEFLSLKQQLHTTGESMKPANLIKGVLRDVTGSSQLRSLVIKAAVGLAVGYIAKRLMARHQKSNKNQMLGTALQHGVSFLAANQSTLLRTVGVTLATTLFTAIKNRRAKRNHVNGIEHS